MKSIAERACPGVICLDIPMCRGEKAALDGDLLLLGGGNREAFDACAAAFNIFAKDIYYLGDLGTGQVGKMVNNLILWSYISAKHEGMALVGALGVDTETLREALLDSSARNWAMEIHAETWDLPWAEKDMLIVFKEADTARISLSLCGSFKEVIKGIKINLSQGIPRKRRFSAPCLPKSGTNSWLPKHGPSIYQAKSIPTGANASGKAFPKRNCPSISTAR